VRGKDSVDISHRNEILARVEPEDFIQFGMIPEFIGRFNCIANCNELTEEDLVTILVQPKNAVVKQFKALFSMEGVNLEFTDDALKAIAKKAHDAGTGARALRMILENIMRDLMFEVPTDDTITDVIIERETIIENRPPVVKRDLAGRRAVS
jgi:ATP-dependent Clp protease ATP-binding subunit ClpX